MENGNSSSRRQEKEASRGMESEHSRRQENEASRRVENGKKRIVRRGKQRGSNRQTLTSGGMLKQKKALKRKSRRKVNREIGKSGIPAKKKSNFLFIDNTKNGTLAKMMHETEKRLGGMTSYRVRVVESAVMALSR